MDTFESAGFSVRAVPVRWVSAGAAFFVAAQLLCHGAGTARASDDTMTLRFADPMTAIINARRWDETHQQWLGDMPAEPYFDAAHRFLLVRFPGSAETVHAKLADGWVVASAHLMLKWAGQEWRRRHSDYSHRGWGLPEDEPAAWHARVWLLRRPWTAHRDIGPTWNAYIQGAGWWTGGGGSAPGLDRVDPSPGRVRLCALEPFGEIDVTLALHAVELGATTAERLRALESCGFLLHKDELYDPQFGDNFMSTGNLRLSVAPPELAVVLRRGDSRPGSLPPAVDVAAMARQLKAGGGGAPTTRIPENLAELSAALRGQPAGMADWMWERVQEVHALVTPRHHEAGKTDYAELLSGDRERHLARVDLLMRRPPGWYMGHSHMDMILPLLAYDAALPDALRYHLTQNLLALWGPLHDRDTWRWGIALRYNMATLNHQSQNRAEALLAGERLGSAELVEGAKAGIDLLTRQMIYGDGTLSERGDTFYLGISLAGIQSVARFSECPLYRLKASLAVEKMLFESNLTYHPGLRRRVSRVSRIYGLDKFLLGQDVPEAALHTLSRNGVLIETGRTEVHGVPTLDLHATKPERVAALAPWGAEWEHHVTDGKPLPFRAITTDYVRALIDEPIYETVYMGRHYALASRNADSGSEWPVHAAWRRHDRDVETLEDRGVLFPWGYVDDTPANRVHGVARALPMNMATAALQHENTLLYVMTPPERAFMERHLDGRISNLYSRVSIYAFGPRHEWELWADGERIEDFPHRARCGDVLAIKEGVTYLGLIALPATDLGRRHEVLIDYAHPHLTLDAYVLDSQRPVALTEELWNALQDATAGWVIRMSDASEQESFEDFRRLMQRASLRTRWEPATHTLHVTYENDGTVLELGVNTVFERSQTWQPFTPSMLMAHQRVNGRWPWPDRSIDMDSPLGQMGCSPLLHKAGASLSTGGGQKAMLRVEPVSGTYVGINPFIDPQPFALSTPEGVVVRSDGPLGLARVTVRPRANTVWVDYRLPPPTGDTGAERLQDDARAGKRAGWEIEAPLSHYFPESRDVRDARRVSARALLVSGMTEVPRVVLNGAELPGPFPQFAENGVNCFRIPIVR